MMNQDDHDVWGPEGDEMIALGDSALCGPECYPECGPACDTDDGATEDAACYYAMQGDAAYLALLDELREVHLRKAADYGSGVNPLANLRASVKLGIPPWVGCVLRLNDKMSRVHSLIRNGRLVNEPIEDNLLDMASYALLALRLYREAY